MFPSGKQYVIGCGIYNMEMDKAFIEDVVNRVTPPNVSMSALEDGVFIEFFTPAREDWLRGEDQYLRK